MRPHERRRRRATPPARSQGFTLTELLIVIVIIGILLAFILGAAMSSIRRAEERATQALISKLETGITDRLEALVGQRAPANNAHAYLAAIYSTQLPNGFLIQTARTQTIAQIDAMKAEMPDVFVVQGGPPGLVRPLDYYPLNFAAASYGGAPSVNLTQSMAPHFAYFLPIGAGVLDNITNGSPGADPAPAIAGSGQVPVTTGIYGASYTAAAGLYKQLAEAAIAQGATAPNPANRGYNGIDDDGNGLIDELAENGGLATIMASLLANHTHKTARAEVLYALLVEGQGPLGSVFSRDEFTDREVRDTDGDGLLEFVDAWGEPVQFFRWPMFYSSDVEQGASLYQGIFDTREQNPLDPNQQLMAPAWWSSQANNTSSTAPWTNQYPLSGPAADFQRLFFPLIDPNADPSLPAAVGRVWDRGPPNSDYYARRAYYSRFLVVSGGPDMAPGVPILDPDYWASISGFVPPAGAALLNNAPTFAKGGVTGLLNATQVTYLRVESQAAQATPTRTNALFYSVVGADPIGIGIIEAGNDDITSHNLQAAGGATQ